MAQIRFFDPQNRPIPYMVVRFAYGHDASETAPYDALAKPDGSTGWPIPNWPRRDYTLHVNKGDYKNPRFKEDERYVAATELDQDQDFHLELDTPPLPPITPVTPLHVQDKTLRRPDGALFQYNGYSMFLAYRRFLAGDPDLDADLSFLSACGVTVIRVFGPLDWRETPDYTYENFNWDRLSEFFQRCAGFGLYVEFVPVCYRYDTDHQRDALRRTYDAKQDGLLVEGVNEPSVGDKANPVTLYQGIDRRGVLSAYGIYDPYYAQTTFPFLDYTTIHTTRDDTWARKARHAQELQDDIIKVPVIADEPAKAVGANPGESGYGYPGGKTNPAEFVWYHAVAAIYTPGSTFHCEEGKWGRIPKPGMLQYDIMMAVRDNVWKRIGPEWQLGSYDAAHLATTPVNYDPTVWAYSTIIGNRAISVRCAPVESQPVSGWRKVEAWGPGNSIMILER